MTDNEIIKGINYCANVECRKNCDNCPIKAVCDSEDYGAIKLVNDLINRQKAEIAEQTLKINQAKEDWKSLSAIIEVQKAEIERLLKIAKNMHTWIFLNSGDEEEAYKECGLTLADNALFGYGGKIVLEIKEGEQV